MILGRRSPPKVGGPDGEKKKNTNKRHKTNKGKKLTPYSGKKRSIHALRGGKGGSWGGPVIAGG